jgi:hypothetical protein
MKSPVTRDSPAMQRLWMGVIAAVVVSATGMHAAAARSSEPEPVVLTSERAAPALLALDDMASGWTPSPNGSTIGPPSATGGICNGPNAAARAEAGRGSQVGSSRFYKDAQVGPIVAEAIYTFPDAKAAKAFLAATEAQVAACSAGWDEPNPLLANGTIHFAIAPLSLARLGDQVSATRELATNMYQGAAGATATTDVVSTRLGNNVVQVSRIGRGSDQRDLVTNMKKALAKFAVAVQAAKKAAARKP